MRVAYVTVDTTSFYSLLTPGTRLHTALLEILGRRLSVVCLNLEDGVLKIVPQDLTRSRIPTRWRDEETTEWIGERSFRLKHTKVL